MRHMHRRSRRRRSPKHQCGFIGSADVGYGEAEVWVCAAAATHRSRYQIDPFDGLTVRRWEACAFHAHPMFTGGVRFYRFRRIGGAA